MLLNHIFRLKIDRLAHQTHQKQDENVGLVGWTAPTLQKIIKKYLEIW